MCRYHWSVLALGVLATLPHAQANPIGPLPAPPHVDPAQDAASPQAHMPLKMELPAQPLADAMQSIARLANLNILADPALLAPHTSPALSGQFSADAALRKILQGSELRLRYVDERTLILVPQPRGGPPD